jgi:N-acetylmuramoyl-L-alanine amidase
MPFTATSTLTDESSSPTWTEFSSPSIESPKGVLAATTGSREKVTSGQKNFHKSFAIVSLGFALMGLAVVPRPAQASSNNTSVKRDAASSQFGRAEEMREALNAKAPDKRTLAEYKAVVSSYRRVYLITPHATQVPDALVAIAELNGEMGDRFGRSYYQMAVESYQFLIKEYPTSKYVPDAMLSIAKLEKNQLGDSDAAARGFQDYLKKFPHSPRKREVQEEMAELALMKNAETGQLGAKNSAPLPSPAPSAPATKTPAAERTASPSVNTNVTAARVENVEAPRMTAKNGGESAASGGTPRIQRIKTNVTQASTEVVIELEDSVQYSSGRILNPDRIYFDLHAARLSPSVARGNVKVSGDLLTKVRVAQNQSGVVRVVLDVNGVQDYAASLMKKPTRLVIELYGTAAPSRQDAVQTASVVPAPKIRTKATIDTPLAKPVAATEVPDSSVGPAKMAANDVPPVENVSTTAASTSAKHEASSGTLVRAKSSKSGTKPDLVQPTSTPELTRDGQSTLTRALGLKIGRIVIDAGHGGHDTGTIGPTGLMEKDLCLDVALRLGKLIQQKLPDTEIIYTRSDDTFIPLEERTHIANETKADLFVSIHANSSPDHLARGVETYYLNLKGSPEAMEVAARENAVSQENIHDLEDVVKKIARTEKIDESKELAEDIQDSLSKRIQKTAKPVKNRGVRKAPFVVLIGADMPSILTEISFLSNPADEQLLKKPEHRQRIAEGVFAGVTSYLQSMNSMNANSYGKPVRPPVVSTVEQSRNQN